MGKTKKLYWYVTVKRWVPNTSASEKVSRFVLRDIGNWDLVKEVQCKSAKEAETVMKSFNDREDRATDGNRLWNASVVKR